MAYIAEFNGKDWILHKDEKNYPKFYMDSDALQIYRGIVRVSGERKVMLFEKLPVVTTVKVAIAN